MRADMAKILVERPRPGSRSGHLFTKGYRKKVRRALDGEATTTREGMTRPYHWTKPFNENLAPLRRFIQSQIGRPWNKVYAEICAHIDRGNVVQKHILTHLFDYVVTDVVLTDGVPCAGTTVAWSQYGIPLNAIPWLRAKCYVCPRSGILKRVPRKKVAKPSCKPAPPEFVRVNDRLQCKFIDGRWELVTLAPLPADLRGFAGPRCDVITKKFVADITPGMARAAYGDPGVYAVARRVIGKREQKQYPIPIEFVR